MSVLATAAATWYRHCFQRIRSTGYYDRGSYVRADPDLSWHRGNIQPASQADVLRLPEGSRTDGAVVLFTDVEMRTYEAPNTLADRVMYGGVEYTVSNASVWESHKKYTLTKVGQ